VYKLIEGEGAVISGLGNTLGGSSTLPSASGAAARTMELCHPKGALRHLKKDARFDKEIRDCGRKLDQNLVAGNETFSKILRLY
jgi:hypothetical protein